MHTTTWRDEQERRDYITRQVTLANLITRLEQVKQSTERTYHNTMIGAMLKNQHVK